MSEFTYFAKDPATGLVKIGRSQNPSRRVIAMKEKPELFAVVRKEQLSEESAHAIFSDCRKHGEWFAIAPNAVLISLKLRGVEIMSESEVAEKSLRYSKLKNLVISDDHHARIKAIANSRGLTILQVVSALLDYSLKEAEAQLSAPVPPRIEEPQPEEAAA